MSEHQARAEKYRREAAEIRKAAEIVQDERFREQLLSIADQYDAFAENIEAEHRSPEQLPRPKRAGVTGTAKIRSGRPRRRIRPR